jgi:hypothetical protein
MRANMPTKTLKAMTECHCLTLPPLLLLLLLLLLLPGIEEEEEAPEVDAHGNKFESISELMAQEKAARAARRGGGPEVQEEEVGVDWVLCKDIETDLLVQQGSSRRRRLFT